ncbi:cbb3-type cytochrome c oxidase subunit 3 [Gemmobacter caeruleus]|uniref:cbb3-type cytochrome c oxidase subunit 3 n=1 Tax=Gemmobacter caeruleus TaxID=2595004 RepID=UPI0011EF7D8D|nr:cbb3-type cytochrome c oxidase subunit 3 [Gemmobacter caeruleus]
MDTYSFLRHFADSWMLILMTALFVGVVVYAFRPGSGKLQDEAANSIFRNEKRPAAEAARNYKEA